MRRTTIACALLLAAAAAPARAAEPPLPDARARAWQVGLLAPDRLQHAGLSFALATSAGIATREPEIGAAGTLVLGIAKEWRDGRSTRFDPTDLAADALGALAGAVLVRAITR